MGDSLLLALGLVLVFEGLLPFLNPGGWRRIFEQATRLSDGQLRFIGLTSMVGGLLMLVVFR